MNNDKSKISVALSIALVLLALLAFVAPTVACTSSSSSGSNSCPSHSTAATSHSTKCCTNSTNCSCPCHKKSGHKKCNPTPTPELTPFVLIIAALGAIVVINRII